jgi:mycothiol synthase
VSASLRPLTAEDAQSVADLFSAYDAFHNGITDRATADDVLDWWRRVDVTVAAVDDEGRILGFGSLRRRGNCYVADNFVHPDARGLGVGSLILDWSERRTADAGLPAIRAATSATDPAGKALLESRGYGYIRSFYRMVVDLEEQPPAPEWRDGFAVALEPEQERLLYEALEEAFADHWGYEPRTFEEWIAHNGPFADRLCYLVRASDGTVAAGQICDEDRFGTAWIAVLGVRPAWRRRGLGELLLRQAFHDLYARGRHRVTLGVDAENTTGATRLYERVGMAVSSQDDAYEKVLEPVGR